MLMDPAKVREQCVGCKIGSQKRSRIAAWNFDASALRKRASGQTSDFL